MMTIAISKASPKPVPSEDPCKPRANYLKPKEVWKTAQTALQQRFDLQHLLNYLKLDI
jgi:hypothetical protein